MQGKVIVLYHYFTLFFVLKQTGAELKYTPAKGNSGERRKAMKAGTKALNTDIVKVMQGIVNSHVEHYQSDFELDIEVLKEAAGKPERTERIFVWLCRPCGTWLLREKNVFIKRTRENNTFCFYAEQTRDAVQCCVIEVHPLYGDTVRGNLFAFNYPEYYQHVKFMSVSAGSIVVDYANGSRILPPEARIIAGPDYELGNFVSYRFVPESAEQLDIILQNEKRNRDRLKEDYQILGYELYEYPKSPQDKGRYHGKTPILEQAETAVRTAKESGIALFIKAGCSDGKERYL